MLLAGALVNTINKTSLSSLPTTKYYQHRQYQYLKSMISGSRSSFVQVRVDAIETSTSTGSLVYKNLKLVGASPAKPHHVTNREQQGVGLTTLYRALFLVEARGVSVGATPKTGGK